jgi:hypothetical protein
VVRARYLLACDGARSTVRRLCGVGFGGSTFAQRWLVVDAEVDAPVLGVPGVRFVADPRRPAVTLPLTPALHRWEFMLGTGEEPDWRALVAPWIDPGALRLRRLAEYTYHARIATRWRSGPVVLGGDAAHVMPPFAGQGLSAGLRDVDNAAWKLAAVLRDGASEGLLDTVESERRPDVVRYTRVARMLGAVVQTRRPRLATVRDLADRAIRRLPAADAFFGRGGGRPVSRLGPARACAAAARAGSAPAARPARRRPRGPARRRARPGLGGHQPRPARRRRPARPRARARRRRSRRDARRLAAPPARVRGRRAAPTGTSSPPAVRPSSTVRRTSCGAGAWSHERDAAPERRPTRPRRGSRRWPAAPPSSPCRSCSSRRCPATTPGRG